MDPRQLSAILAREYGYLDAKHGMGYNPPFGYSAEYDAGRRDWREHMPHDEVASYKESLEHGWN